MIAGTRTTRKAAKRTIDNTPRGRQALYTAKQAEIFQTLDALKSLLEAHHHTAAQDQYHWGHIGDLTHIQAQLDTLVYGDKE